MLLAGNPHGVVSLAVMIREAAEGERGTNKALANIVQHARKVNSFYIDVSLLSTENDKSFLL